MHLLLTGAKVDNLMPYNDNIETEMCKELETTSLEERERERLLGNVLAEILRFSRSSRRSMLRQTP